MVIEEALTFISGNALPRTNTNLLLHCLPFTQPSLDNKLQLNLFTQINQT